MKALPRSEGKRGGKGAEAAEQQRQLYALPLSEFTQARDVLAKELSSKGRSKDAQATRKLKRPVVAAWAVNQLVHQHPEHIDALLASALSVEQAQRRVISGQPHELLREAQRAFQRALDVLMNDVTSALTAVGRPAAGELVRQVNETLRAASMGTEDERSILAQGMLTQPLRSSGFGAVSSDLPLRSSSKPVERSTPTPPLASQRKAKAQRAHDVEQRQLQREAHKQAGQAERSARQAVTRTKATLRTWEAKSRQAQGAFDAAEARVLRARQLLEAAEEQARKAREALAAAEEAQQARAEELSRADEQTQAAEQSLTQAQHLLRPQA